MSPNQINSVPLPLDRTAHARWGSQLSRFCYWPFALVLWMGLSAAGCVDQQKEVGVYRSALEGHAPATTRPAAQPLEAGTRLSLTEAMALVSRDDERLAMSGEDYLQALIDKDRTVANFLPTISLSPVYLQTDKPGLFTSLRSVA